MDLPAQAISATGWLVHKVVDSWFITDYKGKQRVIKAACGNTFYYGADVSPDEDLYQRCTRCFKNEEHDG